MTAKPRVIINIDDEKPFKNLDWKPYLGKEVDVVHHIVKNILVPTDIIIPQIVSSKKILSSEQKELSDLVEKFLEDTKIKLQEAYPLVEAGRCIIRASQIYSSEIFTSYNKHYIDALDYLPAVEELIEEALSHEKEARLDELIIIHTHTTNNAPLSRADIYNLYDMAAPLGLERKDRLQIIAIPVKQKGELIFRYTFENQFTH